MHMRTDYGNDTVDELLCYFMRTILRLQKRGAAQIPIDVSLGEPADAYLKTAVALMENAEAPETTDLVLQVEYQRMLQTCAPDKTQLTLLYLIQELTKHIRFDADMTQYLLDTANLWNDKASAYLYKTFYINQSEELQQRHGYLEYRKRIPADFLEPDNF